MNKIVTQDRSPASNVALSQSGSGSFLKAESLGDVVRFAELMCQSKAGIPSYLHGNAADCMAVTMQALQWEFNPFSVAQKSYKIKDVIAYEAQLIAAVINTRADLKRRPQIAYSGDGDKRKCIVTFEFRDGSVQVYESPEFARITPKNSPLWKSDPDQQHAYYSLRAGARRYCPEVILGAYDRDEVEDFRGPDRARDITERVIVDPFADDAYDPDTGEIMNNEATGAALAGTDDARSHEPSSEPAGSPSEPAGSLIQDGGNQPSPEEGSATTRPPASPVEPSTSSREWLIQVARMLWAASQHGSDIGILKAQRAGIRDGLPAPEGTPSEFRDKANSIFNYCEQVLDNSLEPDDAERMIAGVTGCEVEDLRRRA